MSKYYDIVLFGATGFTGTLISEYFATKCSLIPASTNKSSEVNTIRLAIAGRNSSKLEEIKAKMIKINPNGKHVDILIGDTNDQKSIDAVVSKAEVVLAAAGPFSLYGTPVVDACVRFNAHYCDITGETKWARSIIDKYHEDAKAKHLKIVPFSGYDSIPSDMGAWMVADHITNKLNATPVKMTTYIGPVKGAVSGGTVATIFNELSLRKSKRGGPNNLCPGAPKSQDRTVLLPSKDKDIKKWIYPWLMGIVNTLVVKRSAFLNPKLYGEKFRYSEAACTSSFVTAWSTTLILFLFAILGSFSWTKSIIERFLPAPGQGPSKATQDAGLFVHTIVAYADKNEAKHRRVVGKVTAKGDPGYKVTSQIVGEAALCLAMNSKEMPDEYGVITPSNAMGSPLLQRLRSAGISFDITEPGI